MDAQAQHCACSGGAQLPTDVSSLSVPLSRIDAAVSAARNALTDRLNAEKPLVTDERTHMFDNGFCVSSGAANASQLTMAFSGVVNRMPYDATMTYDMGFFNGQNCGEKQDILMLEIEILVPLKKHITIPLRAIGATRDVDTGMLLDVQDFEFAANFATDVKDVLKVIGCILACVGLFCGALCGSLCLSGIGIPACLACLTACIGAAVPQFLICVNACGVAVRGLA